MTKAAEVLPNFDDIIRKQLEQVFPIKVSVDDNHGYFTFDERFPPFEGTKVRFNSASYDDVSNHMSFSYDVVENPKNIPEKLVDLQQVLFRIVLHIYEIESRLLLNKSV